VFNSGGTPQVRASFLRAEAEARAHGAAWVNAERGGGSGGFDEAFREEKVNLHDAYRVGSGYWMWKQLPGFYNWHTVEVDGSLRADSLRAQQLSRPHVDTVPGELLSTRYEAGGRLAALTRSGG
jgi:hypothetical protein